MDSLLLGVVCCAVIGIVGLLTYVGRIYCKVPVKALRSHHQFRPIAAPNHTLMISLASGVLPLEKVPGIVIVALLLHEDDRFFLHSGFNWPEILVQVKKYLAGKKNLSGGSSISQQLTKSLFELTHRYRGKRWRRKLVEIISTVKLERNLSKREILTLYLNTVRFGLGEVYGIESAARTYFGKSSSSLGLFEAFFLFGLIPRPLTYAEDILVKKNREAFRYTNAYHKLHDIYRVILITWGWNALQNPETITCEDAISLMSRVSSVDLHVFPPEVEFALSLRAIQGVEKIHSIIDDLIERAPSILPQDGQLLRGAAA